jgi:hypothetical protein
VAYRIYQFQKQFCKDLALKKTFSDFFSRDYHTLVVKYIDDTAGTFLPNFPNYYIVEQLYRHEFERLPPLCSEFVQHLHKYINQVLLRLFDETFCCNFPQLTIRLKEIIEKLVDVAAEQCRVRVQEILQMEERIFTLNHY